MRFSEQICLGHVLGTNCSYFFVYVFVINIPEQSESL